MNDISINMYICLITSLSLMLLLFRKESKKILLFMLFGLTSCLVAGFINEYAVGLLNIDRYTATVNIAPIIEEVLKAIPIILFTFIVKPSKWSLLECSMAVGIGFSLLENFCLMYDNDVSLVFAFVRGIGTGLMHGVCTLMVGYALSYVLENKEVFILGTFESITVSIIYHSSYNILIQSSYPMLGVLMPLLSYIPLIIILKDNKKNDAKEELL